MFTLFDALFWLAFGVSITPGLGTGFFGLLFALTYGYLFACFFEWLSCQVLVYIPTRVFPTTNTASKAKQFFRTCFDNAIALFGICLLAGVLVVNRWTSFMLVVFFFG